MSITAAKMSALEAAALSCLCTIEVVAHAEGEVRMHHNLPCKGTRRLLLLSAGLWQCQQSFAGIHQFMVAFRNITPSLPQAFTCTGGLLAAEAIDLLRQFYTSGNPNGKGNMICC